MTEELDPAKIPTQPKRSFNLMLVLVLVGIVGIALYYFLSRHYAQAPVSAEGDPELAQFELDAQLKSLQPVMEALESYYAQNQRWPENLNQTALDEDIRNSFSGLRLLENGTLSFQGSAALGRYREDWVQLAPVGQPGTQEFTWRCASDAIPDDYLPKYCRHQ